LFRYRQGIVDLNAQVPDRAFDLRMPEQELNRPQIASASVDQRRLCSTERVCSEQAGIQSDAREEIFRGDTPVAIPQPGHFDYDLRIAS
jgi:hypothetical protein